MNIIKTREELFLGKTIYDLNLNVAYYSRVSTDKDEQLNSLENQKNYFEDLIKANKKWNFYRGYIDEGISGTAVKNRENFLQMIEDAIDGKIDLILTKEVSRFARNTIDSIKYTELLLKNGVIVLFLSDNINTIYPDSEFRLTLMASLAQDEVRKLSERVKFGIKRSIKDGKVGGSRLTGYIKKDNKLIINSKEVPIIKLLFSLYATGNYSFSEISKILMSKGYLTKMGKPYSDATLKKILTNPRYKGYYTANLSKIVDYKTHKKEKVPVSEQIIYKDETGNVPAIIEEKLWDKANEIYTARKDHWNKININKTNNIKEPTYSSLIFCKEHNKPFIRAASSKRKLNPVWQCNEYLRKGKSACLSPLIKENELDTFLISILSEKLDLNKVKNSLLMFYKDSKKLPKISEFLKNKTLEKDIRVYTKIFINKIIVEKTNNNRKHLKLELIYNFNSHETRPFILK